MYFDDLDLYSYIILASIYCLSAKYVADVGSEGHGFESPKACKNNNAILLRPFL